MANFETEQVAVTLSFENGLDSKGQLALKKVTYRNVQLTATANELHAFAQSIASLSRTPLTDIVKTEQQRLVV